MPNHYTCNLPVPHPHLGTALDLRSIIELDPPIPVCALDSDGVPLPKGDCVLCCDDGRTSATIKSVMSRLDVTYLKQFGEQLRVNCIRIISYAIEIHDPRSSACM